MNVTTAGHGMEMMLRRARKPHLSRHGRQWKCYGRGCGGVGDTASVAYAAWADAHYLQELARINREARAQLAHAYSQEQFWSLNGMN